MENASALDFSGFISALSGSITPAQILTILGSLIGVCMVFVLMWVGVRKGLNMFQNSVKGKKTSA